MQHSISTSGDDVTLGTPGPDNINALVGNDGGGVDAVFSTETLGQMISRAIVVTTRWHAVLEVVTVAMASLYRHC